MEAGQITYTVKPFEVQLLCFQGKHYFFKKFRMQNNDFLEWSEAMTVLIY